jgi:uncharacterized protein with PIN domain
MMASKTKRDANRIAIDGGGCCKCGEQLQRFKHASHFVPKPGRGYHVMWDQCPACNRVYVYPEHFREAVVEEAALDFGFPI